ncbi:MAG: hypothetical protein V1870_02385 [Candidatus Aenigmatarchaeota archaeon]
MTGLIEYRKFGLDELRAARIAELGCVKPIDAIVEYLSQSSCIRRGHGFGYYGNAKKGIILIGLCCEEGGPSLALYPSIEIADSLSVMYGRVQAVIPSYEFRKFNGTEGFVKINDIENTVERSRKTLAKFGFDVVSSEDDVYRFERLDMIFSILQYVDKTYNDAIGKGIVRSLSTAAEIADILIAAKNNNVLVIADQGSAGPVIKARQIAKKLGIENEIAGIFYLEPLALDGRSLMYHGSVKNKIFLRKGDGEKIMHAISSGGSREDFEKNGGDYNRCVVAEIESLISPDDAVVQENYIKCVSGKFNGCREHKIDVERQLEIFLEGFE